MNVLRTLVSFFSYQIILKSIYIRRIAADLGIDHIWVRSKTVVMDSKMSETVFDIIKDGMTSDSLQSSLTYNEGLIEVKFFGPTFLVTSKI
jgi:hypothetical protein